VGERELAKGAVMIRDMKTGEQEEVKLDDLVSFFQ